MTEADTLSTTDLAALLGVSARHVQQLAAGGIIAKAERGRYPWSAVTRYVEHLRSDVRRGPADLAAERARLVRARADLAEADLAQRRGELLARGDVDAAVGGAFARVRARLLAIPSSTAPLLVGADMATAGTVLRAAIHDALQELADTTPESLMAESQQALQN